MRERSGLKRKRSRPSQWWAANTSSSARGEDPDELAIEKNTVTKKKRVSLPAESSAAGAGNEDIAAKKSTTKKKARFSLPASSSLPESEIEGEVNSSALKRQRTRPSEWWAVNPGASEPKSTKPAQAVPAKVTMSKKKTRFSLPTTPTARDAEDEDDLNTSGGKRERRKPSEWWAATSSAMVGNPARAGGSHEDEANTSLGSEDILGSAIVPSKYITRGKPSSQDKLAAEEVILEVQTASSAFGRGRPSQAAGRVNRPIDTSKVKDGPSVAKKGSKTSKSHLQSSQTESSSSSAVKKAGRPSNSQSSKVHRNKASKSGKRISEKESQIGQPQSKRRRKSEDSEYIKRPSKHICISCCAC